MIKPCISVISFAIILKTSSFACMTDAQEQFERINKMFLPDRVQAWFFHHSPQLMGAVNYQTQKFEVLSSSWECYLGRSIKEICSQQIWHWIHPDDIEKSRKAWMTQLKKPFINRYLAVDKSWVELVWDPEVIEFENNHVLCSAIVRENARFKRITKTFN